MPGLWLYCFFQGWPPNSKAFTLNKNLFILSYFHKSSHVGKFIWWSWQELISLGVSTHCNVTNKEDDDDDDDAVGDDVDDGDDDN